MPRHRNLARGALTLVAGLGIGSPLLLASAKPSACSGPPSLEAQLRAHPNADSYAALGDWFGEHQETDCAIGVIQSGLKLEPSSGRLQYLLGLSLYVAGRMREAVGPLRQAVQHGYGGLQAHLLLGAALASLGRNQEAKGEWQAALKIDPTSPAALDGLAKNLIAAGDYDAAIRTLRSAPRDKVRTNESLTLDLAIAYRKAWMNDEAAQALEEGLQSHPSSDALTVSLVSLDVDEGHLEAASTLAEKIARLKPNDLEAQRIELHVLTRSGKYDAAASLGRKLLALAPHDADLLNVNGLLEEQAGDYAAARKHLEEAVALSPNDFHQRLNLGVVLARLKDAAGARKQFEKAIALGANPPQVYFELAKVLRTLGQTEAAERQLALYRQRVKEESDQAIAVSKATEAAEAVKAGDNRKAASLYREACAAQPGNASLTYGLALVLDDLGDLDGERAALQQAIHANPHFVAAQFRLGYMDYQAGNNAAAEREFRLTVEALPDNVRTWIALAATLGAENRLDEARQALAHALKLDPDNAAAQELSVKLQAAQNRH